MARDRQRSKARQRARAEHEQRGRKARRDDAPAADDTGLGDETVQDSGLVAPGFESNAEAEIVEAAETGAPLVDGERDDDDFTAGERTDRAPDELELPADLRPARRGRGGDGGDDGGPTGEVFEDEQPRPGDKDRNRLIAFFAGCIDELRRVQWPNRQQVFQATAVVLGFVLVAGGYLGLMDAIWKPLINAIL